MIQMVNIYGNAYVTAATERRAAELEKRGFKRVEASPKATDNKADMNKMTVAELERYAAEHGIDLTGCSNKALKLEKIKASV